jgi:hypothetical protein
MLRFPMHGFARRVDDAVARAMAFLMSREDCTLTQFPSTATRVGPKAKRPQPETRSDS